MQQRAFVLIARLFGIGSALAVLVPAVDLLRRGESAWLLPAVAGGAFLLLSLPAVLLLVWGLALRKAASGDGYHAVNRAMLFCAAPLVVGVVAVAAGFVLALLAPPGMAPR